MLKDGEGFGTCAEYIFRNAEIRSFQADSLERMKRYCMLSSSTNY